jgi:hypothetical protein
LNSKPILSPVAGEVGAAFSVISATRTGSGFGPNPISLAEISAYIALFGEPVLPVDAFVGLMIKTDIAYMKLVSEDIKRGRELSRGRKT